MDLYLPADYLSLREELDNWRDAPCAEPKNSRAEDANDDPDPTWQVL
ncbi:MAG TPA: hypothetical protein PKD77_02295 [Rudaea sp.]|nr:hypothetical protein [Rudaea sp.]